MPPSGGLRRKCDNTAHYGLGGVMKGHLLSGIALAALFANSAIAADMAVKAPPPAPIANWTGGYVGVTAGAAWGSYDPRTTATNTGYFAAGNVPAVNAAGVQSI